MVGLGFNSRLVNSQLRSGGELNQGRVARLGSAIFLLSWLIFS
jgi:hypothetical protein